MIKTPSDLKNDPTFQKANPYFFDRKTMKFFKDTMRDFKLWPETIKTREGAVKVYHLYNKRRNTSYFYNQITLVREWKNETSN